MKATRGFGLLEGFLANSRYKIVKYYVNNIKVRERVLDIGCGAYPLLLNELDFKEKYGIDKYDYNFNNFNIKYIKQDLELEQTLPFEENFFNLITMLAVIEHLNPEIINKLFSEIYRVLNKDGLFILTTPSKISKTILETFANIGLVSKEEIYEHKKYYSQFEIFELLKSTGFKNIIVRKFQFGFNIFAISSK